MLGHPGILGKVPDCGAYRRRKAFPGLFWDVFFKMFIARLGIRRGFNDPEP